MARKISDPAGKVPAGLLLFGLLLLTLATGAVRAQDANRPIYVSLLPHFVVNLGGADLMQIKAQVLVGDPDTEAAMKLHMPAIRHHLLMLFSDLDKQSIDSAEEKEKLTVDALAVIRNTLKERGAPDQVSGFFITNLVIQ